MTESPGTETPPAPTTPDPDLPDQPDLPGHSPKEESSPLGTTALTVALIELAMFVIAFSLLVGNVGVLVQAVVQLAQRGGHQAGAVMAVAGTIAVIMILVFLLGLILVGSAVTLAIQAIRSDQGRRRGIVALLVALAPLVLPTILLALGLLN